MKLVNAAAVALLCVSCAGKPEPKFAQVADLLCEGLEEFRHLHNDILSVHLLIERGDFAAALQVTQEILASFDERHDVEGLKELQALVFILESIVSGVQKS